MCKNNNNKATKNKSNEKKKAKSTPKIGGFMNDIKNNYFFMMSNKKCHNLNFGVKMVGMGKSLDYKKIQIIIIRVILIIPIIILIAKCSKIIMLK